MNISLINNNLIKNFQVKKSTPVKQNNISNPVNISFRGSQDIFVKSKDLIKKQQLMRIYDKLQNQTVELNLADLNEVFEIGQFKNPYFLDEKLFYTQQIPARMDMPPKTEFKNEFGRAFMLAELMKNNYVDEDIINQLATIGTNKKYKTNFSDNFSKIFHLKQGRYHDCDYMQAIFDYLDCPYEKSSLLLKIMDQVSEGYLSTKDIKDIMPNLMEMSFDDINGKIYLPKLIDTFQTEAKEVFGDDTNYAKQILKEAQALKDEGSIDNTAMANMIAIDIAKLRGINSIFKYDSIFKDRFIQKKIDYRTIRALGNFNEERLKSFANILKNDKLVDKLEPYQLHAFIALTDEEKNTAVKLLENDKVNVKDVISIALDETEQKKYNNYLKQGINPQNASIMANVDDIKDINPKNLSQLLDLINVSDFPEIRTSEGLNKFLRMYRNETILGLNDYIKSFNLDELGEVIPLVKSFRPEDKLKFYDNYYRSGKITSFNPERLRVSFDLTDYLETNPISASCLNDLLIKYPATSREVGSIPDTWLNKTLSDKDKATKEIYHAIEKFQKEKDVNTFQTDLSEILNKQVEVTKINSGNFGICYKIDMEDAIPSCLKIFKEEVLEQDDDYKYIHGQHIEVQTGMFANKHSNNFVKMFFGKVSPFMTDDGFMVTQYLDDDIEPLEDIHINREYDFHCHDVYNQRNVINGKIIDFGDVSIKKAILE